MIQPFALRGLVAGVILMLGSAGMPCLASVQLESAGASYVQTDWDLGQTTADSLGRDGKPQQWVTDLWAEFTLSRSLTTHLQWAACKSEETSGQLSAGDCAALSFLLCYQLPEAPWLLQIGYRTAGSSGALSQVQQVLTQRMAEPVLGAPQPEPVRGAAFHLGGVFGHALSHRWDLFTGASYELRGDLEPLSGVKVTPGNHLSFLGGVEYHAELNRLGAQLGVIREDAAELDGDLLREGHTTTAVSAWLAPTVGALRIRLDGQWQRSGHLEWPSASEYQRLVQAGPATLWSSRVTLSPHAGWPVGASWTMTPGLVYEHRRVSPMDLPYGEGWAARFGPHLGLAGRGPEIDFSVAWLSGRWRSYPQLEDAAWRDISGLEIKAALAWRFGRSTTESG